MAKRVYWWITDAGRRVLRDVENEEFLAEHPEYIQLIHIPFDRSMVGLPVTTRQQTEMEADQVLRPSIRRK